MTRFPLLLPVLALLALQAPPAWAADPVVVHIDNFAFVPPTLTVAPGTTVIWENRDDTPHRVVSSTAGQFKSPVLDSDEKYSRTFDQAGSFPYFCSLHPHMTGVVEVRAP